MLLFMFFYILLLVDVYFYYSHFFVTNACIFVSLFRHLRFPIEIQPIGSQSCGVRRSCHS